MQATAAVSIDLDGARFYHRIHGLPEPDDDRLLVRGLERLLDLLKRMSLRATLFVVTEDVARADVAVLLRQAHAAGHELASHSHTHPYALSRMPKTAIAAELSTSRDVLATLTQRPPVGFRAPGYNQSDALTLALVAAGFTYDSSVLPSPLYFCARAAAIAVHHARGRRSHSVVGSLRQTFRRTPFLAPQRAAGLPLVQLPIGSAHGLPFLGTVLCSHDAIADALTRAVLRRSRPAILELHAIDACGPGDVDGLLVRHQPDARVPVDDKLRRLARVLTQLRAREVIPLCELAARERTQTSRS